MDNLRINRVRFVYEDRSDASRAHAITLIFDTRTNGKQNFLVNRRTNLSTDLLQTFFQISERTCTTGLHFDLSEDFNELSASDHF